ALLAGRAIEEDVHARRLVDAHRRREPSNFPLAVLEVELGGAARQLPGVVQRAKPPLTPAAEGLVDLRDARDVPEPLPLAANDREGREPEEHERDREPPSRLVRRRDEDEERPREEEATEAEREQGLGEDRALFVERAREVPPELAEDH